ncbi:MAG: AcrR family transcriptional regulator [Sulfurimonas sp.]|jgi:AcrR family transcriptional regulator|uniref:TetR/AcrR family transcriptional regulator n=1 Tax=Sulfurimonas sp. TaxID=2022749 RepID=UPI0039E36F85
MNKSKESTYHHGNLKDELINEALVMVKENGVESITLRELTKKLGASRSAIYRHYSSKDELITAVIHAGFEKLDASIVPALTSNDSVINRFKAMGQAYLGFALQNPNIYRMIFGHVVAQQREESCDLKDEESTKDFHRLVSLLVEGQEKKVFKVQDPILQAIYIWSNMHGLANLYIDGHMHIQNNLDELYELSFDNIINGMKY